MRYYRRDPIKYETAQGYFNCQQQAKDINHVFLTITSSLIPSSTQVYRYHADRGFISSCVHYLSGMLFVSIYTYFTLQFNSRTDTIIFAFIAFIFVGFDWNHLYQHRSDPDLKLTDLFRWTFRLRFPFIFYLPQPVS